MSYQVKAEIVGNVLSVDVTVGDRVDAAQPLLVLESMKMEIPVLTEFAGVVREVVVRPGDVVHDGDPLVTIEPASGNDKA